jgi:hypothetical protein
MSLRRSVLIPVSDRADRSMRWRLGAILRYKLAEAAP